MSKYIRTKDGVYEVKEKSIGFYIVLFEKVLTRAISNENIIKEADTIEELCDVFICESNEEENDFYVIYPNICSMMKSDFFIKYYEHYNFYAGIQVKGKGIIYVAKVTSKGGLISYEPR